MSHGPADRCLDLVLVADGFPPDGQERFVRQVRAIVTEVLAGLLAGDPDSYINATPSWTPGPPFTTSGMVGVPDLLRIAGVA